MNITRIVPCPLTFVHLLKKQILLILLAPLLLSIGWPPLTSGFILFLGFIPLLILEGEAKKWYAFKIYIALLLWNIGTTWWVWNASPEGCIAMLLANSGLMLLPFIIYRRVKNIFGLTTGLTAWILSWLSMEYLHLNWEIAYPWLNLGNGLSSVPQGIQWYEYTGTLGGTFWILLLNCLIFSVYLHPTPRKRWLAILTLLIPVIVSYAIAKYNSSKPNSIGIEVVVVQPNIDPYQKFDAENPEAEVRNFITMVETKLTQNTEFVLFPETGFTETCEEAYINHTSTYRLLASWLKKYPNLTLISGSNTYKFFDSTKRSVTARRHYSGQFYDIYNSSIVMNQFGVKDIYRKSKLVPGVEKMPYPQLFSFLENYAIDLGGISGSLGNDSIPRVFYSKKNIGAAPLICYESIFGEYVSQFVKNGANFILVLTNDGWWGNTPGHKHHMQYATLRAIENRRDVVRCTNTGISCIIDAQGQRFGESPWWSPATLAYTVYPQTILTFYTIHGDFIGIIATWLFGFMMLMVLGGKIMQRKIFS